ncbi:MAG: hypothetical protein BRC30_01300 [Nanohaloarchaea archaeon SW_7_46_7]|nr:MAG: hypothetical protein BRC30_01300 [Nanohaloarchaea archaeon SW_7_46_7]
MGVKLWMVFEAVAPSEEAVEGALEEHLETLESEDGVEMTEQETEEVSKVQNPHPDLEEGYSQVSEVKVDVGTFTKCINLVLHYGPTYVQVEGPDEYEMDLKESQESLQKVANTMQQYARQGLGGILVSKSEDNS